MSDYLSNLAARSLNLTNAVQPRLASPFEPLRLTGEFVAGPLFSAEQPEATPLTMETEFRPAAPTPHPEPPTQARVVTRGETTLPPPARGRQPEREIIGRGSVIERDVPLGEPQPHAHPEPSPMPAARPGTLTPVLPQMRLAPAQPLAPPAPAVERVAPPEKLQPPAHAHPEPSPMQAARPGTLTPVLPQIRLAPAQPLAPPAPAPGLPTPTIQVTIGRIEVKATPPAPPSKKQRPAAPVMSLEEYLRRRAGGGGA